MTAPINLADAAFWDDALPHQQVAWAYLQEQSADHVLQEFARLYRDAPKAIDEPSSGIVTPELMERLTGYPSHSFNLSFCNDANRLFKETGFERHLDACQMLMANMMHETANFIYMKEIADGWAYEGRADLGNTEPGDGPRFKGAGVLQLTGRYNYSRLSKVIGDPQVMDGVDYVCNKYPFTSARVWIDENDLLNVCLRNGFDACCKRINGGWNGYEDRKAKYAICQREMR